MSQKKSEVNPGEQLITLSPKEMVDFFIQLEQENRLNYFFQQSVTDTIATAIISYWEKWLNKEHQKLFESILSKVKNRLPKKVQRLPLGMEHTFSKEDLLIICSHIGAIQLTFGCSGGCTYCGFDSLPGPREHIPFSQLAQLFRDYGKELARTQPLLYWASEPTDYHDQTKTYCDVHNLAITHAHYAPTITTRQTADPVWLDFLAQQEPGQQNRVSVFGLTPTQINKLKKNTTARLYGKGRNHDPGIGLSSLTSPAPDYGGIGCFNGILLTPRGIYNIVQLPHSERFPQAQIVIPIDSVRGTTLSVGDSLWKLLRFSAVQYHNFWRLHSNKFEDHLLPYLSVYHNGAHYDVAIDKNLTIKRIVPSTRPEIEKKITRLNMKQLAEFSLANESMAELIEELQSLIEKNCASLSHVHTLYDFSIDLDHLVKRKIIDLKKDSFTIRSNDPLAPPCMETKPLLLPLYASREGNPLGIRYVFTSIPTAPMPTHWIKNGSMPVEEVYQQYGGSYQFTVRYLLKEQ